MMRHTFSRAFNLVEAAIVLGIIGLVMGGIWVAASHITQNQRINETAQGILTTANNVRNLYPISQYPTTPSTSKYIGDVLNAAKAYPGDFKAAAGQAVSPLGARIEATLDCWSTCPMLAIKIFGPGSTNGSKVTGA